MSAFLEIIGWVTLVSGGFFCMIGAIGLHRMPDLFTRMHATSVSDTMGVGLLLIGMLTLTDDWMVAVRLVIIGLILFATSPVAAHALARAALHDDMEPLLRGEDGVLRKTPPAEISDELEGALNATMTSEMVLPEGAEPPEAPSSN